MTEFHDLRHPYVKHTTKKYFLQKQKSQTIKHTAMVWDSGFFNYGADSQSNRSWTLYAISIRLPGNT